MKVKAAWLQLDSTAFHQVLEHRATHWRYTHTVLGIGPRGQQTTDSKDKTENNELSMLSGLTSVEEMFEGTRAGPVSR